MALINRAGQEISAKVVYYGPGLSGKTTNLEVLFRQVPEESRGKMISMKTRTDRTLFFDLLPLNADPILDFQVRILLYTVPGQVYYNATRRLVLKGVDAVVFVADSQRGKMQENLESLENLRSNLADMDLKLDDLPWVIQYNKRDLPDILSVDELEQALNPAGVPSFGAVAPRGEGVHETLRGVSDHLRPELQKLVENEMGDQLRSTTPQGQSDQGSNLVVPEPAADTVKPSAPAPVLEFEIPVSVSSPEPEVPAMPSPPQGQRSGVDLDHIPDPPVIEMPSEEHRSRPVSSGQNKDMDSLIPEDPRQSLREVETTIHASPLRSLSDPEPDELTRSYESLLQSTEPESPALDVTAPGGVNRTSEPAAVEPDEKPVDLTPPPQPISEPKPVRVEAPQSVEPPISVEPIESGPEAEVLELVIPRRLIRDGQLTLRLRLEEEPAAQPASPPVAPPMRSAAPPESPADGRVALRNGELVSLDGDGS